MTGYNIKNLTINSDILKPIISNLLRIKKENGREKRQNNAEKKTKKKNVAASNANSSD